MLVRINLIEVSDNLNPVSLLFCRMATSKWTFKHQRVLKYIKGCPTLSFKQKNHSFDPNFQIPIKLKIVFYLISFFILYNTIQCSSYIYINLHKSAIFNSFVCVISLNFLFLKFLTLLHFFFVLVCHCVMILNSELSLLYNLW